MVYIILLFVLLFIGYQKIAENLMKPPKNYPNPAAIKPQKRILICAGDSLTHGNVSYDWVSDLSAQLSDYQAFNAGVNADLTYTLINRLDDIIAMKPHHINILIGCNDIMAQSYTLKKNDRYITANKIPWGTQPSIQTYQDNLKKIISRLKQETTATISLMSIPIIGEDRQHPIYKMVFNYNKIVKNIADTEGSNLYNPLTISVLNLLNFKNGAGLELNNFVKIPN